MMKVCTAAGYDALSVCRVLQPELLQPLQLFYLPVTVHAEPLQVCLEIREVQCFSFLTVISL